MKIIFDSSERTLVDVCNYSAKHESGKITIYTLGCPWIFIPEVVMHELFHWIGYKMGKKWECRIAWFLDESIIRNIIKRFFDFIGKTDMEFRNRRKELSRWGIILSYPDSKGIIHADFTGYKGNYRSKHDRIE